MKANICISSICLLFLLFLLPQPSVHGQSTCPFSDQEVVVDTLEAKGYLPFEPGLQREYVRRSGAFLESLSRLTVVGDTLIDGELFYKNKLVLYEATHVFPIVHADTAFSYLSVIDGILFSWTPQRGRSEETPLDRDFNSCYAVGSQDNAAVVEGEYDSQFSFQGQDPISLNAIKEFSFFGGIGSEKYGYGIGLLSRRGDPSVTIDLTYFRNREIEYGTPLEELFTIRVSTEENPLPWSNEQVDSYPNPFKSTITIRYDLQEAHWVNLTIYNVLGQEIKTLISEFQRRGEKKTVWNGMDNSGMAVVSGAYFYQLRAGELNHSGKIVLSR